MHRQSRSPCCRKAIKNVILTKKKTWHLLNYHIQLWKLININCKIIIERVYKTFDLTMSIKNIPGLAHMAWWLSLPPLDEGMKTGSPLVPYKLTRLLPHKGRVPGCSRDSPSWYHLLNLSNCWAAGKERIRRTWKTRSLSQTVHSTGSGLMSRSKLLQYVLMDHGLIQSRSFKWQKWYLTGI